MNKNIFKSITGWQLETFGKATPESKLEHLKHEIIEVEKELESFPFSDDLKVKEEFADCFILLMGAAASYGMTYSDIIDAVKAKHKINKKRKWGKPDNNGVVKHID